MRILLATLNRLSKIVRLHDGFSSVSGGTDVSLSFSSVDHAEAYLNFWKADAAATTALRFTLYRSSSLPSVFSLSDSQVMRALAAKVVQGALVISEGDATGAPAQSFKAGGDVAIAFRTALYRCEQDAAALTLSDQDVMQALADKLNRGTLVLTANGPANAAGGWPTVRAATGAVGALVPDSITTVNLSTLPDILPVAPLLPLLEELQMEGADVLPEIAQTLEQIDLSLGSINLAGVSLEPTPSKVAQIKSAMADASQSVSKALDDL